ncbi:polar amino acid transport system substrate-binding protein [Pseudorhizobium tarimense]|uniref:Polar amino acid transport system substrate-binding protein n=1 Tax=Pseudorhizobium tarimense TaxID=1079109 RepID=A0ABV2H557_9HYPH|nr:ABC transporter substrate-binding protein [Pseudorhizobium tarimense]MCJ8518893.1 ABC transporter substrate-binding protein [Pseudorhizobium tarimense]
MSHRKLISLALAGLTVAGVAYAQDPAIKLDVNKELHERLPEEVKAAGKMISVNNGSFPPYEIVTGTEMTGASADLTDALGQLLGIEIEHATVGGLPALLAGVNSGRYQFAFGPVGDYKDREAANDFVDWVQEYVVFATLKGNPKGITSLDTACGQRISVMAGGSAERVIKVQSEKCVADGKDPVEVQSYTDQPASILAVRSKRADAFFSSQAPLTYFVSQSNGQLELAGVGEKNGFEDIYQGAVVPKGSPLGPLLMDAIKVLMDNGTYATIMKKWGLENNMIKQPGINLGGQLPK